MTWKPILNNRKKKPTEALFVPKQELYLPSNQIIVPNINKNHTNNENCLHCGLFSVCSDPNKGFDYVCDRFRSEKIVDRSFNMQNMSFGGSFLPKTLNKNGEYSDLDNIHVDNNNDLEDLLSKIIHQFSTNTIRDLRIDDGDLPLAKNYIDFWFNPVFVGTGETTFPFAKQIEMAINLFSEWCPCCSNGTYARNIPVDASLDAILEQVTMLENGKCPKCKQTRLEFWNNKEYKYKRYTDMIGIAGQRSGKTAGVNRINGYHFHRMLKFSRPQKQYGVESNVWLEGCFTATTFGKALENLYDPLISTLRNNPWFCIEEGSKISLHDNTQRNIEDIKIGDKVKTFEGESVVVNIFDNGFKEVVQIKTDNNKILSGTKEHKIKCLNKTKNGFVWKNIEDIDENDYIITE